MQVYRGMDIGTAKPTIIERRGVTHHMIDVVEPEDEFSVAEFRRLARRVIAEADRPLIVTGGSGLHFRAVVDPMSFAPTDPELRAELEVTPLDDLVDELRTVDEESGTRLDLANKRRVVRAVEIYRLTGETPSRRATSAEADDVARYVPELEFTAIGVDPGDAVDERIATRLADMRSGGLIEEVARLRNRLGRTARSAVGYAEVLDHLNGGSTLDEAFALIEQRTKKLARKQRTWFQRDPRIRWIPWCDDEARQAERVLEALA